MVVMPTAPDTYSGTPATCLSCAHDDDEERGEEESEGVAGHLRVESPRDEILAVSGDEDDAVGADHTAVHHALRGGLGDELLGEALLASSRLGVLAAQARVARLLVGVAEALDGGVSLLEALRALLLGRGDGGGEVSVLVGALETDRGAGSLREAAAGTSAAVDLAAADVTETHPRRAEDPPRRAGRGAAREGRAAPTKATVEDMSMVVSVGCDARDSGYAAHASGGNAQNAGGYRAGEIRQLARDSWSRTTTWSTRERCRLSGATRRARRPSRHARVTHLARRVLSGLEAPFPCAVSLDLEQAPRPNVALRLPAGHPPARPLTRDGHARATRRSAAHGVRRHGHGRERHRGGGCASRAFGDVRDPRRRPRAHRLVRVGRCRALAPRRRARARHVPRRDAPPRRGCHVRGSTSPPIAHPRRGGPR